MTNENDDFKPIESFETVTEEIVRKVAQAAGMGAMFMDFHEVDIAKGAGIIDQHTKCIWTKKGHRITAHLVTTPGGGFIVYQSKEIDPMHDPANRPPT